MFWGTLIYFFYWYAPEIVFVTDRTVSILFESQSAETEIVSSKDVSFFFESESIETNIVSGYFRSFVLKHSYSLSVFSSLIPVVNSCKCHVPNHMMRSPTFLVLV